MKRVISIVALTALLVIAGCAQQAPVVDTTPVERPIPAAAPDAEPLEPAPFEPGVEESDELDIEFDPADYTY